MLNKPRELDQYAILQNIVVDGNTITPDIQSLLDIGELRIKSLSHIISEEICRHFQGVLP
jgi:hypothetical protein